MNSEDPATGAVTTEDRADAGVRREAPRARRPGVAVLFPRKRDAAPEGWLVSGPVVIGRGHDAGLRLDDSRISRSHAVIAPAAGGIVVKDSGSLHGSFVNGERVDGAGKPAPVGSVLRFGDTLMWVVDDIERHRSPPRRLQGQSLGLPKDMIAGPTLAELWDQATRVARLAEPVLILGPTGSGKECVARIVHAHGLGRGRFVDLNIAAVPDALFEAELFGHEKGAFTGATGRRAGAFQEAKDGVLFLDEVGELRLDLQVKLLRAIDLRRVRPLGASQDVPITARVVSATSRDLRAACEAGAFRTDLSYRLSGLVLRVPPLRERRDDIVLLALEMLHEPTTPLSLSADAAEILVLADWEGNARQLRHALGQATERALASSDNAIRPEHLPDLSPMGEVDGTLTEKRIQVAMLKAGGVAQRAAEILGVSRTTLYNAMKRLNIDPASLRGR